MSGIDWRAPSKALSQVFRIWGTDSTMVQQIRIRVRGPQGVQSISLDAEATWGDLLQQISAKTGVESDFDLKYGYPPQSLNTASIDNDAKQIGRAHV